MRIISGIFKGRTLKSPVGKAEIRPTTDRAKETLFNILHNRYDFENMECADLFCGTGNLGIEFLSRGGKKSTFVDIDTITVKNNIEMLKLQDRTKILRNDVIRFLDENSGLKFDIAFADPPYNFTKYDKLLKKISVYKLIFILEHDKNFKTPDSLVNNILLSKKIGISNFTFFDFNIRV